SGVPDATGREVDALRGQLTDLQDAAADLVGADDADTVLARLRDRAAAVVLATACVVVADVNLEGAQEVAAGLGGPDVAVAVRADVTSEEEVRALVDAAALAFGGVDLVVN
ncbi:SDR family NAD(P)-dependent oxidoreductase, partial [Streptococcus pyogenes]|uniref:SDR family NAD(P)-dependent oxidoreductase n=1 Tax=Streptococcus pyogenes TaxID=1314 RepID=UPI003DA0E08F